MAHNSFKNALDSLDYTIIDNNSQYLGIGNLGTFRQYLFDKRDEEYKHIDMHIIPYILRQIIYIIEINFKFNDDEVKAEYNKLGEQFINWFIQCNTQDENGNDDVDIIE